MPSDLYQRYYVFNICISYVLIAVSGIELSPADFLLSVVLPTLPLPPIQCQGGRTPLCVLARFLLGIHNLRGIGTSVFLSLIQLHPPVTSRRDFGSQPFEFFLFPLSLPTQPL